MSALNNFNKVLTWADFHEVPAPPRIPGTTIEQASIGVSWTMDYAAGASRGAVRVSSLTVDVVMPDATMNTIAAGAKTDLLKTHEQGHYDIIALGAREFYNRGRRLTAATDTQLTAALNELNDAVWQRATDVDARYDTQTRHHIDQVAQARWNTAIASAKTISTGTVDDLPT